jgi:hypothetical protein
MLECSPLHLLGSGASASQLWQYAIHISNALPPYHADLRKASKLEADYPGVAKSYPQTDSYYDFSRTAGLRVFLLWSMRKRSRSEKF